jgi:hypothetical protein
VSIPVRLPWDSQPQEAVGIDWSNPLTKGIVAAAYPGGGVYTVASGITLGAGTQGRHWTLTGGTTQAIDVSSPGYTAGMEFSGIAVARSRGLGSQAVININFNGTNVPFMLSIGITGPVNGAGYFAGGWKTSGFVSDVRNDGLWHVIGGAVKSGSQRYFVDGRLNSSGTGSGTSATVNSNPISFGCYKNDSASLNGDLALGVVWADRFLTDAEIAEISANPWQLFAPRSIWVPVSAASGAYTLSCDAGAFTIAGQDATLLKSKVLAADAGAYSLAGQDATLVYTPVAGAYTLTCDAGSYSLAGQDAAFVYTPLNQYTLTAEAGAYSIGGQAATFAYSGGGQDTHDGYWSKQWLKLRKKPELPTIAEVVEMVREEPAIVEAVRVEVERKYPQVDYSQILANVQLQRFIAKQLLEAAQEEDDLEVLLLA